MRSFLIYSFFIWMSFLATAQAQTQTACWQNEIDPRTDKRFTSQENYNQLLQWWREQEPALPNPFALYRGWNVSKQVSSEAKRELKNDKQMHCYVGCRISQEVSFTTAAYAGWRKEFQDLTDCAVGTRFEIEDYTSTVNGAKVGYRNQGANVCLTHCESSY